MHQPPLSTLLFPYTTLFRSLQKKGHQVSRRRIGRIMKEQGLVSKYTVAQYKPQKTEPNEEAVENVLDRNFNDHQESSVVVSDLTYVRVNNRWSYVCFFVDRS